MTNSKALSALESCAWVIGALDQLSKAPEDRMSKFCGRLAERLEPVKDYLRESVVMSVWNRIHDSQPNDGEMVLVYIPGDRPVWDVMLWEEDAEHLYGDEGFVVSASDDTDDAPVYWRRLPSPPVESMS